MAADDITSQDGAVIGDDLVEALGFEPITADAGSVDEQRETSTSEVAVLDDTALDTDSLDGTALENTALDNTGLDDPPVDEFVDPPDGNDIEIIADEAEPLDDTIVDEPAVDEPVTDEAVTDEAVAEADVDQEADAQDVASTSLFGAAAPAYVGPTSADTKELEDQSTADDAPDDAVDDDSADEDDSSPVVFFNNAVDTDTAPLPDLVEADTIESGLDETSVDEPVALLETDPVAELEATELETTELATTGLDGDTETLDELADETVDTSHADLEIDADADIDLSDPPPPNVTSLIDLDRGDDLAVGDDLVDEEATAVPLQRQPFDTPSHPDVGVETQTETALETADSRVEPVAVPTKGRRKKLRARKSRRVVRHIDPWSVLTFSVLFHLCFFAALLLASVLVWNAALAAGTIENIENFVRELGDYETFEINSDQVFKAATLIAGLLTLASSVLVVLLTVVFNLISDLIGGIRVTVIEEETVRIPRKARK